MEKYHTRAQGFTAASLCHLLRSSALWARLHHLVHSNEGYFTQREAGSMLIECHTASWHTLKYQSGCGFSKGYPIPTGWGATQRPEIGQKRVERPPSGEVNSSIWGEARWFDFSPDSTYTAVWMYCFFSNMHSTVLYTGIDLCRLIWHSASNCCCEIHFRILPSSG